MRAFIDTNLWVYRIDQREPLKAERVRHWLQQTIEQHEVVISTQVLIELRAVANRKLLPPLSPVQISDLLEALSGFEGVSTDAHLVLDAHALASWFDALIAEAAIRSGCDVLFSDALNHGAQLGSLRLINPLLPPPRLMEP